MARPPNRATRAAWCRGTVLLLAGLAACGRSELLQFGAVEQRDAAPPDLGSPADAEVAVDLAQPDLAQPDLAQPDLARFDLAAPPDLTIRVDLATTPDLGRPIDLRPPPDLVVPVDLVTPIDLAPPPDLRVAADLAVPPDLAVPRDLRGGPDLVACGAVGQNCCDARDCAPGSRCTLGTCTACGSVGQPCCDADTCTDANATCQFRTCAACGGPGQPCCQGGACRDNGCCDGSNLCIADGAACQQGVCMGGSCSDCGTTNHPCCAGSTCKSGCCTTSGLHLCVSIFNGTSGYCDSNALCTAVNTCTPCGLFGIACCPGNRCSEGVCTQGQCVDCGTPGKPCCQGACLEGGCCGGNDVCVRAGGTCDGGGQCSAGTCQACGSADQPCCSDNRCNAGGCCDANDRCATSGAPCGHQCSGDCGTCAASACVPMGGPRCGGIGDPCCQRPSPVPGFCTAPGSVCGLNHGSVCAACGNVNQPCCDAGDCGPGGCCDSGLCIFTGSVCSSGGACMNGSCGSGTCGGVGQPCCPGFPDHCTAAGAVCIEGLCRTCGGAGDFCCYDALSQSPLYCTGANVPGTIKNGQILGACVCDPCGPKISEFVTATVGSTRDEWIEVGSTCAFPIDLTGQRLVYRSITNNNGGADTLLLSLTQTLPAFGLLLFAGPDYAAAVDGRLAADLAETGGGIGLRDERGQLVDSVGYGALAVPNDFTETTPTAAPAVGRSRARLPFLQDTNSNARDFFVPRNASPGTVNVQP